MNKHFKKVLTVLKTKAKQLGFSYQERGIPLQGAGRQLTNIYKSYKTTESKRFPHNLPLLGNLVIMFRNSTFVVIQSLLKKMKVKVV